MKIFRFTKIKYGKIVFYVVLLLALSLWSRTLFFKEEKIEITGDTEHWEWDTDMIKYRFSIESDCDSIGELTVKTDAAIGTEDVMLQTILYDGSRVDTDVLGITKENGTLRFRIHQKLAKNVSGAAWFDFCVKKEYGVSAFEAEAKVYTRDWISAAALVSVLALGVGYLFLEERYAWKKRENRGMYAVVLFGSGILHFLSVEILGNESLSSMAWGDIGANAAMFTVLLLLAALLLNSLRNAAVIMGVLWTGLGIANYFVIQFRSQPIQPLDILSAGTAAAVANRYQYRMTRELVYVLFVNLLWILFLLCQTSMRLVKKRRQRLLAAGAGAAGAFLAAAGLYCTPVGKLVLPEPSYWNSRETYLKSGFLMSFLSYGSNLVMNRPPGYSSEEIEKIAKEYEEDRADGEKEAVSEQPNIIVVMNEALADYRKMGEMQTSEKYFPFLDSLTGNCIKGTLLVPTYAGGTANTEYEFLTGNSLSFYGGNGVPYSMRADKLDQSVAKVLKEQGYEAVAMHPNSGSNYNRSVIYPLMGFDEFYTIENLFGDAQKMRGMVSDYGDYSKMLSWIEERERGQPYFIFNITMQNHSDYVSSTIPITVYAKEGNYPDVNEYLTLLKESDKALEYLINELEKQEEKTVLVMFGDHYPGVNENFVNGLLGESEGMNEIEGKWKKYQIPLLIWANYPIENQEELYISANYLSSYLMELLGLETSGYQRFLLDLHEQIPILSVDSYLDAEGEYHDIEEIEELPLKLKQYYWLQYHQLYEDDLIGSFW